MEVPDHIIVGSTDYDIVQQWEWGEQLDSGNRRKSGDDHTMSCHTNSMQ